MILKPTGFSFLEFSGMLQTQNVFNKDSVVKAWLPVYGFLGINQMLKILA